MRTSIGLGWLLCIAAPAWADTLLLEDLAGRPGLATPQRGDTMNQVEQSFGAPQERHGPIGDPPITRWDYAGYSVFFDRGQVLHAVVHRSAAAP